MYLHSMRREVYVRARDGGVDHMLVIHVKTPLESALLRNSLRVGSARVDEAAIRKIFERFEEPNRALVHEKINLTVNTDTSERCVNQKLFKKFTVNHAPLTTITNYGLWESP
jgi:tRNA uridine 5-carbamoylmethylation protein Kti12